MSFQQLMMEALQHGQEVRVPFELEGDGLVLSKPGERTREVVVGVRPLPGNVVSMEVALPPLPRGRKKVRQALLWLNSLTTTGGYLKALRRDGTFAFAVELPVGLLTPDLVVRLAHGLSQFGDVGSGDLPNLDLWVEKQTAWGQVLDTFIDKLDVPATTKMIKKMLMMAGVPTEVKEDGEIHTTVDMGGDMRVIISIRPRMITLVPSPHMVWQLDKELKDPAFLTRLLDLNAGVPVARVGIDYKSCQLSLYQVPDMTPEVLEHAYAQLRAIFLRDAAGKLNIPVTEDMEI